MCEILSDFLLGAEQSSEDELLGVGDRATGSGLEVDERSVVSRVRHHNADQH